MTQTVSKNPMIEKLAGGYASSDLLDLLVVKQLPLTEEEYLEGLIFALRNETYRDRAKAQLSQISDPVRLAYLQRREANHEVARFLLHNALEYLIINQLTAIITNPMFPVEFLLEIAGKGPMTVLEVLLENQIKLIAYPEIMVAMENNVEVTLFIKGRINEIRDFYLKPGTSQPIPETGVVEDVTGLLVQEEEKKKETKVEKAKIQQMVLTTLQRINLMTTSERMRLALIGTKTERMFLIRDPNTLVSMAVLESPKLTNEEVITLAKNRSLSSEMIEKIASTKVWTKNYQVCLALVQNPKTHLSKAVSFLKQLHMRDLRLLIQDRNVSPVVRKLAQKLFEDKDSVL